MRTFLKSIRTKVLVFALMIGLPLQMCSPHDDDCNCNPITGAYFDINGMVVNNYKWVGTNSVSLMVADEVVQYDDYAGLGVEYSVDYIAQRRSKWPSFSLVPSAYACSCLSNGYKGSKNEKLSNITVITLNDFDEDHLANDTINDLILVRDYFSQEDYYLGDYLLNDTINIQIPVIQLKVDKKPALDENYKVKVVVELSTGEVYQKVSESIKIR